MGFDLGRFSGNKSFNVTIFFCVVSNLTQLFRDASIHALISFLLSLSTGEVDEELICPICSQVLEEPVQVGSVNLIENTEHNHLIR